MVYASSLGIEFVGVDHGEGCGCGIFLGIFGGGCRIMIVIMIVAMMMWG
jgi:hypothetical protein